MLSRSQFQPTQAIRIHSAGYCMLTPWVTTTGGNRLTTFSQSGGSVAQLGRHVADSCVSDIALQDKVIRTLGLVRGRLMSRMQCAHHYSRTGSCWNCARIETLGKAVTVSQLPPHFSETICTIFRGLSPCDGCNPCCHARDRSFGSTSCLSTADERQD